MGLEIICRSVVKKKIETAPGEPLVTVYTAEFFVQDDTDPGNILAKTVVEGSNQAEIEDQLTLKYGKWKTKYDEQQNLMAIGNSVAQNVMDTINGAE